MVSPGDQTELRPLAVHTLGGLRVRNLIQDYSHYMLWKSIWETLFDRQKSFQICTCCHCAQKAHYRVQIGLYHFGFASLGD